ncbi:calcium uniporter protein, mitochondrial-like [Clavelina lepadiformis]|uniref:calcium uniporter protein, mitochondrial-like n=1 Tax=Clavelina lepadiformis TaxID=159417 RepID=UPI004041310C
MRKNLSRLLLSQFDKLSHHGTKSELLRSFGLVQIPLLTSKASYTGISKNFIHSSNMQRKRITCFQRKYGTEAISFEMKLFYRNGMPVINVPLPSRQETCSFTLRPVSSTVGDFIQNVKDEDKGIDQIHVYSSDGSRVAASTQVEYLLRDRFILKINDKLYDVDPPQPEQVSSESATTLDNTKILIAQLYNQLHIDQHQLAREQELISRLENLKSEVKPLSQLKRSLADSAASRTKYLMWGGLAFMGTQFGLLARLTWWEYSWDIMEPVTYFITYGTAIIMYGYFLLTQQEYIYPDARDRQFLRFFHRAANKQDFDIERFNKLCNDIAQTEQDLKRLRDPLQLHLPIDPIRIEKMKEENQP